MEEAEGGQGEANGGGVGRGGGKGRNGNSQLTTWQLSNNQVNNLATTTVTRSNLIHLLISCDS